MAIVVPACVHCQFLLHANVWSLKSFFLFLFSRLLVHAFLESLSRILKLPSTVHTTDTSYFWQYMIINARIISFVLENIYIGKYYSSSIENAGPRTVN